MQDVLYLQIGGRAVSRSVFCDTKCRQRVDTVACPSCNVPQLQFFRDQPQCGWELVHFHWTMFFQCPANVQDVKHWLNCRNYEMRNALEHVIQILTDVDPSATVLFVDGVGAFDLISRSSMLKGLRGVEGGDSVLPSVSQFYSSAST